MKCIHEIEEGVPTAGRMSLPDPALLAREASIEITAKDILSDAGVSNWLPKGTKVYVPICQKVASQKTCKPAKNLNCWDTNLFPTFRHAQSQAGMSSLIGSVH